VEVFHGLADEHFDKEKGKIKPGSNADLSKFYPTQVLVTAPEILFFWVARMIIAGYEYMDEKPFEDVYLTGIVRDKQGRKMSKSLGNSPDPLELMKQYGADGVRTGMLFSSPAGNDLLFDEKLCEQGRNFANKIWNAFRLLEGWTVDGNLPVPAASEIANKWFEARMHAALTEIEEHYQKFRISDALLATYKLVWDDFCAWYLEIIKPEYGSPIDQKTYEQARRHFETLLKVLHPFMPFITEELWHALQPRTERDCILVAQWPKASESLQDQDLLRAATQAFSIVTEVRNIRSANGISPKEKLSLELKPAEGKADESCWSVIQKLSNLTEIKETTVKPESATAFLAGTTECYIPMGDKIDPEKEQENIRKEIEYLKGFLISVDKKLSNEKFVASAPPQVVEMERKKKKDAEDKIRMLEGR
jgi:valyl-tRNA synthetase